MLIRTLCLVACVCTVASVTATAQNNQGVSDVVLIPGIGSASGVIDGYSGSLASAFSVQNGPAGTYQIVARPDGSEFYLLANNGTTVTLYLVNPSFTTFTPVTWLAAAPTAIAVTPDNQYLLVGANGLYVLNAQTLQVVQGPYTTLPGLNIAAIVPSRDATKAYVLNYPGPTESYVTEINLSTGTILGQSLQLPGGANSLTMSPLGLLYESGINRIFEINPATMALTQYGTIQLSFDPGPLRFTPDGMTAFAVNLTPSQGGSGSIIQLNLPSIATNQFNPGQPVTWPANTLTTPPPLFSDVLVASSSSAYGIVPATAQLYDITPASSSGNLTAKPTALSSLIPAPGMYAAVLSNELPASLYMYILAGNDIVDSIYRVTLGPPPATSATVVATTPGGTLQFLPVPPQSGATSFLAYNNNQTVAAGATSLPFLVRVLDTTGRPVYNATVNFTTASGATVNTPTMVTLADGYASTTIVAPATGGNYTLNVTCGNASFQFNFTVPGAVGVTNPSPTSQLTIIEGDGQIGSSDTDLPEPLTIQVSDSKGNPLSGVAVTWTVTSGDGAVFQGFANSSATDNNGQSSVTFFNDLASTGVAYVQDSITASTTYGAVTFFETALPIYNYLNPSLPIPGPYSTVINPANKVLQLTAGATLAAGVQVLSVTQLNPTGVPQPIPNLNIELIVPGSAMSFGAPTISTVASCAGLAMSDQTGTSTCNVTAGCTLGPNVVGVLIGAYDEQDIDVNVTSGGAGLITPLTGTGVNGKPGQVITLSGTVTDNCGNVSSGVTVSWSVTQGSGSLSQTSTKSNSFGVVSTNLTLGQTAGTVQVTASIAGVTSVNFTITNVVAVASLAITGGGQTAAENQAFAQPVVVTALDVHNNPLANILISFAITGPGSLSQTNLNTNAQGQASITVTAGSTAGTITITATASNLNAIVNLTVTPPGLPLTPASFTNAASGIEGMVPCGLTTVTAQGIAPGVQGVQNVSGFGPLPLTIDGLSITVGNIAAPISVIANSNGVQSATFQTPCELPVSGSATVVVTVSGVSTTVNNVPVFLAQPGIYHYPGPNNLEYVSIYSATNGAAVTTANPAIPGQTYYTFATNLGPVSPAASTDSLGVPNQNVTLPVVVGVNNGGVQVVFAQYLQENVGVYLVEFVMPANEPAGTNVAFAIGVQVNGNYTFGSQGLVVIPAIQ